MNLDNIKALYAERMNAVSELRALDADAAGREFDAEERAKYDRINNVINTLDERIQNGLAAAEREAKADEARGRIDALAPVTPANVKVSDLDRLVRGEIRSVEFAPERRDLLAGTATDGQELVPQSMYNRVVEHLIEVSTVMQNGATVIRSSGGGDLEVPKTSSYSSASLIAEAAAISESDPQFATVTLSAFKYAFLTQASGELLQDSAFDVPAFLARQGGVALGNGIGAHLVAGDGTAKPNGIFTAASTGKTAAGATTVTGDELIDLYHSVTTGYRARGSWVMKDSSLAIIRKLKDSTGQYLWQPGLQAGAPDSLLGRPVYTDANAPAMTTGLDAVLFGDLAGYFVRLAGPVRVERSDDFAFNTDLVTFRFILRGDGDLVDTNAVKVLTMA